MLLPLSSFTHGLVRIGSVGVLPREKDKRVVFSLTEIRAHFSLNFFVNRLAMNDTGSNVIGDSIPSTWFPLYRVKFTFLLLFQIPSIVLSLLIFTFFVTHRALLHVRQNQALLLLLSVNFLQVTCDLPMVIHFYHLGRIIPSSSAYCTWWTFLEYTLNAMGEFLMATISVQRHLLVFHAHLLNHRLKCLFVHDLPLVLCLLYPTVLYVIIVIFYPCDETHWDFSSNACGLANCYLVDNKVLGTFDWAANNGFPILIIALANFGLVLRVIGEKHRRQQVVSWRKQRRMTVQLLSISCLYFFTWFPNLCIGVVQQLFIPGFLLQVQFDYVFDLTYLICLFLPWICLGLFPQLIQWMKTHLLRRPGAPHAVGPSLLLTQHSKRHVASQL